MELSQVLQALRNADAAGDVEAARRLAQIADRLMRAGPAPVAAPEAKPAEGFFAALGKGAESALSAARAGVKGIYAPEEAAKEAAARQADIGKRYADQVSLDKVKEAYEKRGLLPAAGEVVSQIPYAIAEQGANIATTLGGARVGAMAGAPFGPAGAVVGGLAGAALPSLFQQAGGNIQRQAETGQPIDRAAAYGAALPQAALDVAGTIIPLGRTIAGKVFGPTVAKLLERGAEEGAERLAKESLSKVLAKGTAVGALAEVPTEVVQQMLERAQAGLSLTSTDAIKEYGETMYQTALLSPIGAAGRVAERGQAREIVEERQQKTLAEQAKERRNAQLAAEEAEEARKQSPEYAQEFAAQHEALQQQYNDLTATLKEKLPKGASFADRQANKDLIEQRKALTEQLKEQAPEYNRVMGILKPIREQQAAAAQQAEAQRMQETELAAQREIPQEAQTQPYFQEPQATLPGMEAVPTVTPMPEAEAPIDYARQVRLLKQQLEDIQTQAETTTDLATKLQLSKNGAQVAQALKEAQKQAKAEGAGRIESLRQQMATAESQGDLEAQGRLAQQLLDLGVTDLGAQPELDLGRPQALGKLQVPTDLADYQVAQQRAAEEKAAREAQQRQQQQLAKAAFEATQQTAGMYSGIAAQQQRRAADRAAADAEARAEAERTQREEELVGKLVQATGAVQPQPLPQARMALPTGETTEGLYDKATELRAQLAFAQQTRNKNLEARVRQQLQQIGASSEEKGTALDLGATAREAGVEGELTPDAMAQNRMTRLAQRQLMSYDQLVRFITQAREREQTSVDEKTKAQYKYRAEQLKQAVIGFALQEINGRRQQYGLPELEQKEVMRAVTGLARPLNELIARGAQMFEEPVVVRGQQRGIRLVDGAQEFERPPAGKRTFPEAGFPAAADTLREEFRKTVETVSGVPAAPAAAPFGKPPGPVRKVVPEQRELFLTPPPAEEPVSLAPTALLDKAIDKAASRDDAQLLRQMQEIYTQLKPEQQSVVREQAQRAVDGKPLDAVYEMRGLYQLQQREAATAAGQQTFLKPITLVTARRKIERLAQQAAALEKQAAEAKAIVERIAAGRKSEVERAQAAFDRAREQGKDLIATASQLRGEQTKERLDAANKIAELELKKRDLDKEWDDVVSGQFAWLQTRYEFLREEVAAGRAPKTNRAELAQLEKIYPGAIDRVVKASKALDKINQQLAAAKEAQQAVLERQAADTVTGSLLREATKAQNKIETAQQKLSEARAAEKAAERVHKATLAAEPKAPTPLEQIEAMPITGVTRVFRDTSDPAVQAQATKKRSAIAREEGTYAILEERLKTAEGDERVKLQQQLNESEARLQKLHNELYDVYSNAPMKRVQGATVEAAASAERLEKAQHAVQDAEIDAFNAKHDTARLSLPPRKAGPMISEKGVVKQGGERVIKAEPATPIAEIASTRKRIDEINQQFAYIKDNPAKSAEGKAKQAKVKTQLAAERQKLVAKLKELLQSQREVVREEKAVEKELKGARTVSKGAIRRSKLEATDAQLFEDLAKATKTKEQTALFERAENAFGEMSAPEQAFVRRQANAVVGRREADYRGAQLAEVVAAAERRMAREGDETVLPARGVEVESPDLTADQVKALEDNDVAQALALLSTDKSADPVHRAVAQRLAQLLDATDVEVRDTLTDSEGNPVLGQALASGKKIRLSRAGGLTQEILLHEGTHAAAERVLEAPESSLTPLQLAAKRELQALHAAIKNDPNITSTDAKASLSEFVAEVMSNRNLQQQLAKKPWRLADALKAFKSIILRLLGIKETQSMLGAAMKAVDAIFQPTSIQTFEATGVRTQYSQKDIAALHDGSNSMRQFAENFPQYIKQKDRTPEDVDRIGGEYLLDMRYNPKDYVALAEPERLDYKSDTIMPDGTVFDPENPLHLVEATPTTFVALEAQKDASLREREAKEINKKRLNDLMDLLEGVFGVEPSTGTKAVKNTSYTLPEKALVAKAASKYGVQSTPEGRLKLVTIDANNRHPVAVVSKEAVDAIIEGLRAGKNLKTAFLEGMQRVADTNAERNKAKNGWQKFDQSDTEAAAIALNAGAAGTSWCTGGSVSTARSQIKEGDFYIYYKDGKPEVAVRMNGTNKIGEIRGNTPNQWLTPEQQKIAETFLRTKSFDGSQRFIEETERKAQLARILTDKAEPGDSFIFVDALNSDQTAFKNSGLSDLFEFRMLDGYARSMRPKPSDSIAKALYTKALDALVQDMGKGYIPFDIKMEADGTGYMNFGGQKIDNIKPSDIVHAKNILTPYTSKYKKEKEQDAPLVFSNLKSVGGFYLGGVRPVEMPALQRIRRLVLVNDDADFNVKLSDKAIVDSVSAIAENTAINIKGGYYVNVKPVVHYGTKFLVMSATVEAPYVSVTPYTPDFSSSPKADEAPPPPVINTPNKIGDAPPVKTAGPEAEERLLFARVNTAPRNLNPALAGADAVARRVVAGNRSWWQTVKANTTGLAFETQAIDRFAGFERLSKYLPKLQGTQMMYYLRMYDQRMNFVSQSAVNGALDLREVQRKDGEREFLIESQDGTSLRSVVTTLKRATPMVGNADATSRLFTMYVAANRAKRVGYDKLDLSGQVTEQELRDTLRQVDAVPGLKDIFETARDQYNEYNEGLVRFAQKTGVFSKEYADKLLSAKDYIPWYRSRNGVVELVIGGEVPFKVGNVKDMPHLAELVGGDKPILDFTISSVQNTNMLVDMSLRNLATKNAVLELVDLGAAKVTNKPISGTDVVKFRVKGEDRYAILDTETIKINGKDVNTGVPADLLVKGMEGIPVQLTGVLRAMAMPTNVLRKAVTLMPPYMLRQIVRDSTSAFIASGADATPVLSALREIGSAAGKKLERRGIVGGQMFTGTTEDISQIMREIVGGGNLFTSSIAKLEALGMEADALTRRAQYNSYIKQGLSEMEATLLALESMNFNKRGASPSVHFANSMIPFFNAQVQGLNVLYRAMFGQITAGEKARIKQKLITRGAMMFAASLAYAHSMQDDEAYKNALPEDKYGNWFVRIPGIAEPLRVPVPFEIGYIFKALPEALYNTIVNKHGKEEAAEAFKAILRNTIPGGSSYFIPQVFKPGIEVAANFSFFTGRDIVSAKEQLLLPEQQYRDNTTELAKLFGGAGISPIKFEALIRGYLGGAGMALLGALSLPLVREGPEKATKRMSDMPVIGTMFQPNDARWIINNAFDQLREAQQVQASFKDLVNKGERAEAQRLLETRATDYARAELGGYLRQQMGQLTQLETAIKASNKSPEEKRKLLDQVQQTRIRLAGMVRDASDAAKLQAQAK